MAEQIEIRKEVVKALETLQSILSKLDGIEEQPKKKAGRKPKVVIEEQEQEQTTASEVEEQPKKKAGRKPKAEVVTEEPITETVVEEHPKKKAGRKTKAELEEIKPKAKRIPRVTRVLEKQLDEILKNHSVVPDRAYYKEYVELINTMSDEEFKKSKAEMHMENFANTKIINKTNPEEHNSASGGTTCLVVTENLKEPSIEIFQDENGNQFTGPSEDPDENMVTVIVEDIEYIVGEHTQRVYKVDTNGGPDVFVGFSGVGDCKDIVLP
jgi:hypothetical protein